MQQKKRTVGRPERHHRHGMPENPGILPKGVPVPAIMRSEVRVTHRDRTEIPVVAVQATGPCKVAVAAVTVLAVVEEGVDWRKI